MRKVPRGRDLREVPQSKARPRAQPLAAYVRAHPERDRAIAEAYASGGYTMQEIGDYFGLHYARVSKIVREKAQERRKAKRMTLSAIRSLTLSALDRGGLEAASCGCYAADNASYTGTMG